MTKYQQSYNSGFRALFSRIFLPGCILLVTFALFLFLRERSHQLQVIKKLEQVTIANSKKLVQEYFDPIRTNILFLAESTSLKQFFLGNGKDKRGLQNDFIALARNQRSFDQVRLLDERGMEIIRVNQTSGEPKLVPDNELQSKGKRYYFTDVYKLDRGQIYISPLDLNVEHDKIELPFKPMLRIGTPLFDGNGKKRGIVLINVLGDELLNRLSSQQHDSSFPILLLNKEGYWLKGSSADVEWGFMFPDRKNRMFATVFPTSWPLLTTQNSNGQFLNREGLFTFCKVNPLKSGELSSTGSSEAFASSIAVVGADEYYWILLSHISPSILHGRVLASLSWILPVSFVGISILLFASFRLVTANRLKEQADREVNEALEKMNLILDSTGEGIYGVNLEGRCIFCNPACATLTGYERTDMLIGSNMHALIHHSYSDGSNFNSNDCPICQSYRDGKESHVDNEVFWRPDGSSFPIEYRTYPIRRGGEIIGAVVTFIDITQRKQMESAREEALGRVKKLEGIIPICMYCKRIRDDKNSWKRLEEYITNHSEAEFSHGICPTCTAEQMKLLKS